MMDAVIEVSDLVKVYEQGGRPLKVLNEVDLTIQRGEFMAIMGPSGSGKSTLLNLIGALDRPTSGKVVIDGVDIATLNDNELADMRNKKIGFVFQFFNLIPRMNAIANVELPQTIAGVGKKERRERAEMLLGMVGLSDRVDHKPSQLSGGETQRVAIARALVNNPEVLLCDEITGNLDSKTGEEIMHLMRDLNQKQGKTFAIVTHDPVVAQSTDRIVHIRDGRIVAEKRMRV